MEKAKNATPLVVDMDLCIDFVANKTGINKKTVEKVLMAETEYLISLDIVQVDPIVEPIEKIEEEN